MHRWISVAAAVLLSLSCVFAQPVRAEDEGPQAVHNKGAIGFHETTAPLGVRWWLGSQKVGIDLAVGFHSDPSLPYPSEHLKTWAVSAGVPIVIRSWPRVHVLFRPGFLYQTQQVEATAPPTPLSTENEKTLNISGEIEAEAFLLENFSVSASTGLSYESFDPGFGLDKLTSLHTVGGNFTSVGFHVYLFH